MSQSRPRARLFVGTDLVMGEPVGLTHDQSHYLRSVLRLGVGAEVALFNGRDGEWLARIEGLGKGWCSLQPVSQTRVQTPAPDLWLCFAPIKRTRIDFIAEKATELGVSLIQPVLTRHTVVDQVRCGRLRANAVEAAEQCERLDVPMVADPLSLDALIAGWAPERLLVVAAEAGPARPLAEVAAAHHGAAAAILVGPEGGFAKSELDALLKLPFVRAIGLGPRVLRSETATLAALAGWQSIAGDWGGRPPGRP